MSILSISTARLVPILSFFLCGMGALANVPSLSDEALGVQVPEGFQVLLFADDELAHDVFCMTLDSQGRVVVSGPGYIRILIDEDGDGTADRFQQFADGPKTGAQGMVFHGSDLICVGDRGLIRYRDRNGDDRADGEPDLLLNLKTGGEHHSHSIQRGPDGWWYLISGNYSGVDARYATLPTSPVTAPHGGTILRLKPDFSGGEIFADGFRNAYDFAFGPNGEIFTYDSDGERDVSLPWYEPTRVFHVLPGSHAGWVSRSWKRPGSFLDMPPVIGAFGRGSPTGVACYHHSQFPERYRGAIFVLDWTFGRVIALPLTPQGSTFAADPIEFMTGVGQFGFAPTDLEVGPDGSLYLSVGGRGTRGGVYRVQSPAGKEKLQSLVSPESEPRAKLLHCLSLPQPLSSWSRAIWMPLAKELGAEQFQQALLRQDFPIDARVRAIEICTELFQGLPDEVLAKALEDDNPAIRARTVWSLGRTRPDQLILIKKSLQDSHPWVVRSGLDALLGTSVETPFDLVFPQLLSALESEDRFVRQAAIRVVSRMRRVQQDSLVQTTGSDLSPQAKLGLALATASPVSKDFLDLDALSTGAAILQGEHPLELRLDACRMLQMVLGDVGPVDQRAPVFDGYAPRGELGMHQQSLQFFADQLATIFPAKEPLLNWELGRLISILEVRNSKLLEAILSQVTAESDPVSDIHYLIVAARIPVERTASQREAIVRGLLDLERKILTRKLPQESNWADRIGELVHRLVQLDPHLPGALVRAEGFGYPGHALFLNEVSSADLSLAIEAFVRQIQNDPDFSWSPSLIFVLGKSAQPAHREFVREQFLNFGLRNAVLLVLAEKPEEQDRPKFLQGLETSDSQTLMACIGALEKLPLLKTPEEMFALLRTARRLGAVPEEFPLRDRVMKLLQQSTGQQFGYVSGKEGHGSQPKVMENWTRWLSQQFPEQAIAQLGGGEVDLEELEQQVSRVDWANGDLERGRKLFESRGCARCHGGRNGVGPDLAGVTRRFSRKDLFTAIASPNRDVSTRYQATLVQTTGGQVVSGMIVYESVDGLLLRTANQQTIRIEAPEIELRRTLRSSLMPTGLLKDLAPSDLADLFAYLDSLGASLSN